MCRLGLGGNIIGTAWQTYIDRKAVCVTLSSYHVECRALNKQVVVSTTDLLAAARQLTDQSINQ